MQISTETIASIARNFASKSDGLTAKDALELFAQTIEETARQMEGAA